MKTLSNKNLIAFFISTFIIMLCCFPLFYRLMIHFYSEDLDELVKFQTEKFITEYYPEFNVLDIEIWNKYNLDMKVLADEQNYTLNKIVEENVYSPSDKDIIAYRTLYTSINIEGRNYILMSRTAMIESDDLMEMIGCQYGLFFIILITLLTIIQWRISKKLWHPFYRTLNTIENFNLEKGVSPSFSTTNTKEFVRLNNNLKSLISNNLHVYQQQKEFIENASHELQTPLAIFRSQLDMLLQNSDLTEEQVYIVQSLYDTVSRLTRLNKNLLLLAKIDNKQIKNKEEFDLSEVVDCQLEIFSDRIENKNIRLAVDKVDSANTKANKVLVESLINNLLVNALRYTDSGGKINVSLFQDSLIVENTASVPQPLNRDSIFLRFNKDSTQKGSTGLGLAIVKQICHLHGWEITYSYQHEMHRFKVVF